MHGETIKIIIQNLQEIRMLSSSYWIVITTPYVNSVYSCVYKNSWRMYLFYESILFKYKMAILW